QPRCQNGIEAEQGRPEENLLQVFGGHGHFLCRSDATGCVGHAAETRPPAATGRTGPNRRSKAARRAMSTSDRPARCPRSSMLVTPWSLIPQGTMPLKWLRSGATLCATPWKVTHFETRTPMAA